MEPSKERRTSKKNVQCHECTRYGDIRAECPKYKKSKDKVMNVTLSDESNESEKRKGNFIALTTSMKSASRYSEERKLHCLS